MKFSNQQKIALRQKISGFAKNLGFDLVGFSPAKIGKKYLKVFKEWLRNGNAADMEYMRKIEQRRDMSKILPGAKSVIILGMNYFHEQASLKRGYGRIARYAYGRDYHKVIGKKLKELEKFIQKLAAPDNSCPNSQINLMKSTTQKSASMPTAKPAKSACLSGRQAHADFLPRRMAKESHLPSDSPPRGGVSPLTKSYVDTGPLMERALAEQAGLGRIGKNGCLITERFGSWIFLGEIITTLDLDFENTSTISLHPHDLQKVSPVTLSTKVKTISSPASNWPQTSLGRWSDPSQKPFNICGNCTRCMTSCPTGAIIAPGIIDSRLCISYLTIENRKKIPQKLAKIIKKIKHLFGCDICQEVCPHNSARQRASGNKELSIPEIAGNDLNLKKLCEISSDAQFLQTFAGSPLMRAKLKGIKRNAQVI